VRLVAAIACLAGCTGDMARPEGASAIGQPTATRRVRRLSAREYANTMRDLTGTSVDVGVFTEDTVVTGYDNGTESLGVGIEQAAAYTRLAEDAAAKVVADAPHFLGCDLGREGAEACRERALGTFLRRAYRRPARDDEKARLRGAFADARNITGDDTLALRTMVEAILQSPAFLYRTELGGAYDGNRVVLDDWERASALAYFLTGTMPDDALLDAAARGDLATVDGMRREARRLLATPAARIQVRHFLEQWLALDRLAFVTKDAKAFPELDDTLRAAMREDAERFLDEALRERGGSLAQVFGSTAAFVDEKLARVYGVPYAGTGAQRVELDPSLRRGILTRAAYLAVHSGPEETGPVGRGLFLRSAILCAPTPPPPIGIDRNVPKAPTRTTRERFASHSSNAMCQGCHRAIDGVGFSFEAFDALGRHRTVENGVAIDSSGFLLDAGPSDGPFNGVVELESRLLGSPRVASCFVRQAFRFAMGSSEAPEDVTTLDVLSKGFDANSSIVDLFVEIAASRAFVERWTR
jgi:hypothetical protein